MKCKKYKVKCFKALLAMPCVTGYGSSPCPHYEEHMQHQFDKSVNHDSVYRKCFAGEDYDRAGGCHCGSMKDKTTAATVMAIRMGLRSLEP